jgi:RNA polymerase sigma-70 factor, ECF subfamily
VRRRGRAWGTGSPRPTGLVERARRGDGEARQLLLARHRDRLRRMVAVHLDRRLAARVDPSDVVQEALAEAARKLDDYLREQPLAFYPWLRRLAWERLAKLHQRHIGAERRSVTREEHAPLPEESAVELARRLVAPGTSPSHQVLRQELQVRVQAALAALPWRDREVLVLRYLEQLTTAETAAVLGLTAGAVKLRHLRALERLRGLLEDDLAEGGT